MVLCISVTGFEHIYQHKRIAAPIRRFSLDNSMSQLEAHRAAVLGNLKLWQWVETLVQSDHDVTKVIGSKTMAKVTKTIKIISLFEIVVLYCKIV